MSQIYLVILTFLSALFLVYKIVPAIIATASEKLLFDVPGGRKKHKNPIPSLGGVAIFAGLIITFLIWGNAIESNAFRFLLAALFALFFIGLKDDLTELSARFKLVVQLLAACLVASSGFRITSAYGLFGIYEIPIVLQYILTILFIGGITNAYNLIDGIDGQAGGIACVASVFFTGFFYVLGESQLMILSAALLGSVVAFLNYNQQPAKIFMGDTGSLVIGFLLAVLAIKFMELSWILGSGAHPLFGASPALVLSIFIVPILDIFQVSIKRISQGKSPFSADRQHIHHYFLRMGFNHAQTAWSLNCFSIFVLSSVLLAGNKGIDTELLTLLISGAALGLLFTLRYLSKKAFSLEHYMT